MSYAIHRSRLLCFFVEGAIAAFLAACSSFAHAEIGGDGLDLRFNGFGSLELSHTSADGGPVLGHADDGGIDAASRLGLQANLVPFAHWELVAQMLATGGVSDQKKLGLEWAFLAWHPDVATSVRLGRMNFDLFLASEYRNVGFAHVYARRTADFYALLPSAMEGGDVARSWIDGDVRWRAKAFVGRTAATPANMIDANRVVGGIVSAETDVLLVRASLGRWQISAGPRASRSVGDRLRGVATLPEPTVAAEARALASEVDYGGQAMNYFSLGVRYDGPLWTSTSELTRTSGPTRTTLSAAVVTLGRRFGAVTLFGATGLVRAAGFPAGSLSWEAALTPFVGADRAREAQAAGVQAKAIGNGFRHRVVTLGTRWDFRPNLAMKLQWDHERIQLTPNGMSSEPGAFGASGAPPAGAPGNTRAEVITLSMDGVF